MASIVRTIIPDYQSTNIKKKHFIKIVPIDCFTCKQGFELELELEELGNFGRTRTRKIKISELELELELEKSL